MKTQASRIIVVLFATFLSFGQLVRVQADTVSLPQTGQTNCYNADGVVNSCAGTGQDGDIRAGVPWPIPRFVDNLDRTITDKLTGLMWLKDADCFYPDYPGRPWQEVLTKVADMNAYSGNYSCTNYTAAYNDWRLPTFLELVSLSIEEVPNSSTWLDTQGFVRVNSGGIALWSSTNLSGCGPVAWPSDMQWRWLLYQTGDYGYILLPV
ncbi:MAG: DUF1566 domain-containing protein [Desulfobulbaceae bacterium]|nr:DUF1566 domain-containing protein [Desulfobulbaceae bacterium]